MRHHYVFMYETLEFSIFLGNSKIEGLNTRSDRVVFLTVTDIVDQHPT